MRILFISYLSYDNPVYQGGGWVNSLVSVLSKSDGYEVAIAYVSSDATKTEWELEGIHYYPIYYRESLLQRVFYRILKRPSDINNDSELNDIISRFRPDIVQLFGIETFIGGIARNIKRVPVVVHIQGVLSAILNNWFPHGFSMWSVWWHSPLLEKLLARTPSDLYFRSLHLSKLEQRNYSSYHYYIGRTAWDRGVSKLLSPNSHYYHCDEMLRSDFYYRQWKYKSGMVVLSTVSNGEIYKGFDTILQTAVLLSTAGLNFVWNVYGVDANFPLKDVFEKKMGYLYRDNHVCFRGKKNANELADILSESTFYIHPSHADNSPNALCEAMMVGVPCIASYVGGIPSLCVDNVSGFLVADGDAYCIANLVLSFYQDVDKLVAISSEARKTALSRHGIDNVLGQLDIIYKDICSKKNQ